MLVLMSEQPPNREQNDTEAFPASNTHRYGPPQGPLGFSGQGPAHEPPSSKPSGAFTAAVLVAALVVGGLSGVAGAVGVTALDSPGSDGTPTASAPTTTPTPKGAEAEPAVADSEDTAPEPGSVEEVSSALLPSVVKINVASAGAQGSGSGIILSPDGEILTNNHVVQVASDGGSVTVSFDDGSTTTARVLGTDPLTDLAVIKARGVSGLNPARLGRSGSLDVGEEVVAIGSPFGLEATVTSGIVSALNRPVSVGRSSPDAVDDTTYPAIQTDAAINPGNSGGALVDFEGRVVGVNVAYLPPAGGAVSIGFAIPSPTVTDVVKDLLDDGRAEHPYLGVSLTQLTPEIAERFDVAAREGAIVGAVERDSPAGRSGLEPGDVITGIDGGEVRAVEDLFGALRRSAPGDTVALEVLRDGETSRVEVRLGRRD